MTVFRRPHGSRTRRTRLHPGYVAGAALACALLLGGVLPGAAVAQGTAADREVVVAFHPGGGLPGPGRVTIATVFERLAERPALSLGLLGATQGRYTRRQTLLDLSAGNRVSPSGYEPRTVPRYRLRRSGGGWEVSRWEEVLARAQSAPVPIRPGLLAGELPGGAAYVGATRRPAYEGVLAADRAGRVARVSLGTPQSIAARTDGVLRDHSLAVVALPRGILGDQVLDELLAVRPDRRLVMVIRRPPASETHQMLPFGVAGLPGGGLLESRTTRRLGLVAATDVAPTALEWLGRPVPDAVAGRLITARGERDVQALRALEQRLRVVYPRRFPALFAVFGAVGAAGLALALLGGPSGRRRALRVSALAFLWVPAVSLAAAAIEPSRAGELALMGGGSVALALVTDRLLPWPRGPLLPAGVALPVYVADLFGGSDLIVRSLLGPNPRFGSRFYGIGNELEATLPLLALLGLAALLTAAPRSPRLAAAFGGVLLLLGAVVGAGRLGADVGGVITIGAAAAAAVVFLLPGAISRRRVAVALAVPALALAALALIDVVTGGDAHFTSAVLGADSADALARTIGRRYELAWQSFLRGLMPLITVLAVAAIWWGWKRRARLLAPLEGSPAWSAAFLGGLAGSVAGALSNDSGPVLLVIGVFVLGWGVAYVRGDPRLAAPAVPARAGEADATPGGEADGATAAPVPAAR